MKILTVIVLTVLAILVLLELLAVCRFTAMLTKPRVPPAERQYEHLIEKGHLKREIYESQDIAREKFILQSRYGYSLCCELLHSRTEKPTEENRVAILCHGLNSCRYGMLPYAESYLKRGFSVVIYDQRNHGDSGKAFTSMGFYEKYDLDTVVDWCIDRFGSAVRLVTHGGSMGAATVLSHLVLDSRVTCAVADCGFSDLHEQLKHLAGKRYHFPAFPTIPLIRLLVRLTYKFDLYKVRPSDGVLQSKVPILFIHGEEDTFVPAWMSVSMYHMREAGSRLLLIPKADHGESIQRDFRTYDSQVASFLEEYL